MDRREFLKTAFHFSIITGAAMAAGKNIAFGAQAVTAIPDLVAVKGGAPDAMFDAAVNALGGMKKFVKKGQSVLVKPNIGWDVAPEYGANTNPRLVYRI